MINHTDTRSWDFSRADTSQHPDPHISAIFPEEFPRYPWPPILEIGICLGVISQPAPEVPWQTSQCYFSALIITLCLAKLHMLLDFTLIFFPVVKIITFWPLHWFYSEQWSNLIRSTTMLLSHFPHSSIMFFVSLSSPFGSARMSEAKEADLTERG